MTRMVYCEKLQRDAEGLAFVPWPGALGKRVFEIMRSADALPAEQRDAHVRRQLDLVDGGLDGAKSERTREATATA